MLLATCIFTSEDAYTSAATPLSTVAYHKCCTNFGHPWCRLELQQGYPVSVPKRLSVPSWGVEKLW